MKSSFKVLNDLISDIDINQFPFLGTSTQPSKYDVRCSELCVEHGWTLEEYDMTLATLTRTNLEALS